MYANLKNFTLNRAAVGWAVSCSAFGLFIFLTAQPGAEARFLN